MRRSSVSRDKFAVELMLDLRLTIKSLFDSLVIRLKHLVASGKPHLRRLHVLHHASVRSVELERHAPLLSSFVLLSF